MKTATLERPLYDPNYLSHEMVRQPIRPLGALSNFVVNDLPLALEIVRANPADLPTFKASVDALVEGVTPEMLQALQDKPRERDIALLDLLYLRGALSNALGKKEGVEPSHRLMAFTDVLAGRSGQTPSITYEDLIYCNPFEDPRLFTRGEAGQDELDFYETHRNIERRLDRINEASRAAIEVLATEGLAGEDKAVALLTSPERLQDQAEIVTLMVHVGNKMHSPNFHHFSSYFPPYPQDRHYVAAGGSKSDGWAQFRVLLAGDRLLQDIAEHLEDEREYFPREGQSEIDQARELVTRDGSLLTHALTLGSPRLADAVVGMDDFMTGFLMAHLQGVANEHPQALSGSIERKRDERLIREVLKDHLKGFAREPLGYPSRHWDEFHDYLRGLKQPTD